MKIKLENFKCYRDKTFIFENNKIILLQGPSGIGKSTIQQGIYWCLYGNMRNIYPRGIKPKPKCKVTLEILECTIIRQSNPGILKISYIDINTGNICDYQDDVAQNIIEYMFGDRKLWKSSCYIDQNRRCDLLEISNKERMELLNRLSFSKDNPKDSILKIDHQLIDEQQLYNITNIQYETELNMFQQNFSTNPYSQIEIDMLIKGDLEINTQNVLNFTSELNRLNNIRLEQQKLKGIYDTHTFNITRLISEKNNLDLQYTNNINIEIDYEKEINDIKLILKDYEIYCKIKKLTFDKNQIEHEINNNIDSNINYEFEINRLSTLINDYKIYTIINNMEIELSNFQRIFNDKFSENIDYETDIKLFERQLLDYSTHVNLKKLVFDKNEIETKINTVYNPNINYEFEINRLSTLINDHKIYTIIKNMELEKNDLLALLNSKFHTDIDYNLEIEKFQKQILDIQIYEKYKILNNKFIPIKNKYNELLNNIGNLDINFVIQDIGEITYSIIMEFKLKEEQYNNGVKICNKYGLEYNVNAIRNDVNNCNTQIEYITKLKTKVNLYNNIKIKEGVISQYSNIKDGNISISIDELTRRRDNILEQISQTKSMKSILICPCCNNNLNFTGSGLILTSCQHVNMVSIEELNTNLTIVDNNIRLRRDYDRHMTELNEMMKLIDNIEILKMAIDDNFSQLNVFQERLSELNTIVFTSQPKYSSNILSLIMEFKNIEKDYNEFNTQIYEMEKLINIENIPTYDLETINIKINEYNVLLEEKKDLIYRLQNIDSNINNTKSNNIISSSVQDLESIDINNTMITIDNYKNLKILKIKLDENLKHIIGNIENINAKFQISTPIDVLENLDSLNIKAKIEDYKIKLPEKNNILYQISTLTNNIANTKENNNLLTSIDELRVVSILEVNGKIIEYKQKIKLMIELNNKMTNVLENLNNLEINNKILTPINLLENCNKLNYENNMILYTNKLSEKNRIENKLIEINQSIIETKTMLENIVFDLTIEQQYFDMNNNLENSRYTVGRLTYVKQMYDMQNNLENKRLNIINMQTKLTSLQQLRQLATEVECDVLEGIVDNINICMNSVLSIIFDDPIEVSLSLYKESKSKKTTKQVVSLMIDYQGMTCDNIGQMSGGEADRISFALAVALNQMSNSPLLMLDECMSSLNETYRDACLSALREVIGNKKTVICVNHEDVEGHYDKVIKLGCCDQIHYEDGV